MKKIKIYKWEFDFEFNQSTGNWTVTDQISKGILLSGYYDGRVMSVNHEEKEIKYFFNDLYMKVKSILKKY